MGTMKVAMVLRFIEAMAQTMAKSVIKPDSFCTTFLSNIHSSFSAEISLFASSISTMAMDHTGNCLSREPMAGTLASSALTP